MRTLPNTGTTNVTPAKIQNDESPPLLNGNAVAKPAAHEEPNSGSSTIPSTSEAETGSDPSQTSLENNGKGSSTSVGHGNSPNSECSSLIVVCLLAGVVIVVGWAMKK